MGNLGKHYNWRFTYLVSRYLDVICSVFLPWQKYFHKDLDFYISTWNSWSFVPECGGIGRTDTDSSPWPLWLNCEPYGLSILRTPKPTCSSYTPVSATYQNTSSLFVFLALLNYILHMTLYKFKIYNEMIWYMYVLQNDYYKITHP